MILRINNLTIEYGNVLALKDVNVDIEKGEFVYILGPNGGGKTTLVRTIFGLLKPTKGKVYRYFKNIGYLPQNLVVKKNFPATVFEIVYTGFKNQKLFPTKKQKEKIYTILKDMQIFELKNKLISELSGGQLQRVLFARAIVNDPEILILDEPASALDHNFRKFFYDYIDKLNKQKQTTILIITHHITDINPAECKDRVLYIDTELKFDGRFCDYHDKFLQEKKHAHIS